MQREAGVPSTWVSFVQALVILSVIALDRVRRMGAGLVPAAVKASGGDASGGDDHV